MRRRGKGGQEADEELRKYAGAVDEWRMKLEEIREAEEDVARIVRDRDIL